MRLLIVRHGVTANNVQRRYTGQSDIPLSPLGVAQAEALARRLADTHLDIIVSSDLQRAQQTAAPIARSHGLTVVLDEGLREIHMGAWHGLTHAEARANYPDAMAAHEADFLHNGAPGGESWAEFTNRVAATLARWRTEENASKTILWVTHGGYLGALICHVLGIDQSYRDRFYRDNTAIHEFDVGPDYVVIMRLNDAAHLETLQAEGEREQSQIL